MYNTHRNGGFTVLKILICDDDKQILSQVQSLINRIEKEKNIEFSIDSHTNADFIIHENICYDIAIIDIEMPGISGLKLSEKLKELNQYVIVIILTSFSALAEYHTIICIAYKAVSSAFQFPVQLIQHNVFIRWMIVF